MLALALLALALLALALLALALLALGPTTNRINPECNCVAQGAKVSRTAVAAF
jgi:hypothetical protein